MNKRFIVTMVKVVTLCIIIISVSAFYIYDSKIIGLIIFGLGLLCLAALTLFNILIKNVWPDIVFGLIDSREVTV